MLCAGCPYQSRKFLPHEIRRAPFIRQCTTKGVFCHDFHRSNGTVWKYPCYWEILWNTAYTYEQVSILRMALLEGCLVFCFFPAYLFPKFTYLCSCAPQFKMSPQGGTPPSCQIRKRLRRTQRLCKLQLVTRECSKISRVLRPPDGHLGPWCLLRG